jgi:hypothetical protein
MIVSNQIVNRQSKQTKHRLHICKFFWISNYFIDEIRYHTKSYANLEYLPDILLMIMIIVNDWIKLHYMMAYCTIYQCYFLLQTMPLLQKMKWIIDLLSSTSQKFAVFYPSTAAQPLGLAPLKTILFFYILILFFTWLLSNSFLCQCHFFVSNQPTVYKFRHVLSVFIEIKRWLKRSWYDERQHFSKTQRIFSIVRSML